MFNFNRLIYIKIRMNSLGVNLKLFIRLLMLIERAELIVEHNLILLPLDQLACTVLLFLNPPYICNNSTKDDNLLGRQVTEKNLLDSPWR